MRANCLLMLLRVSSAMALLPVARRAGVKSLPAIERRGKVTAASLLTASRSPASVLFPRLVRRSMAVRAAEGELSPEEVVAAVAAQAKEVGRLKDEEGLGNQDPPVKAAVAELLRLKALLPESDAPPKKKGKGGKGGKGGGAAGPAGDLPLGPHGVPHMDDVVNVCKRRGFIFQSSDVYGGFAGFFDYGPLGVELRKNIKEAWWKDMVHRRDDIVGLDSSIISSPEVWKASGHIAGFSDPMVDCKESKQRFRADQLFWGKAEVDGETLGYVSILESGTMQEEALKMAEKLKKKNKVQGTLTLATLKDYTEVRRRRRRRPPPPPHRRPTAAAPPRSWHVAPAPPTPPPPHPPTPHPAPRTPHPAPRTLHPAPCTPHPAPRTLHTARRTPHAARRARRRARRSSSSSRRPPRARPAR